MSEELNKEQITGPVGAEPTAAAVAEQPVPDAASGVPAPVAAPAKKNDPWKTAFIVLAGITAISAAVFYTGYGKRNDLPTVSTPTVDANAQPVQMGNPPTGSTEQTALSQALPPANAGPGDLMAIPGGGGFDPWANPGKFQNGTQPGGATGPYPVYPTTTSPPGQQMYMDVNPNSPFMQDGNTYVMVPAPSSNQALDSNKPMPPAANKSAKPVTTPTPGTTAPANTAVPQTQPKTDVPAANKPAAKPQPKTTPGKPRGTSSGAKTPSGTAQDTKEF